MNYYNENNPEAAEWLRELIKAGLIPNGEIDTRSITDVRADDIRGFRQLHFFAGIGGWARALEIAGWPADKEVWTGSCPCQPFSVAGKGKAQKDERHLWPEFFRLIREFRPEFVMGEQVPGAIGKGWLDGIYNDLESENYAVRSRVYGAFSAGAPHIRARLYWLAYSDGQRCNGEPIRIQPGRPQQANAETSGSGTDGRLADSDEPGLQGRTGMPSSKNERFTGAASLASGLENSTCVGRGGWSDGDSTGNNGALQAQRPSGSFWSEFGIVHCKDNKTRRIPESVFLGMASRLPAGMDSSGYSCLPEPEKGFPLCEKIDGRVMLLKGMGNAIIPQVAAEFITSFMEDK